MAKYTMTVRELVSTFGRDVVESWFEDYELSDYLTSEEISVISTRGTWTKEKLAERIVDHYFLREIGVESPGEFIHYAKISMRELMETYAPLIYSASIKYDPLVNVNYSEIFDRTQDSESQSSSTTSSDSSSLDINSDTPQGQISKSAILQGNYASSTGANESEVSSNDSSNATGSGTEHYTKQIIGNSGVSATSQAMIKQYREIVRALNTEIIYELAPLFMGLY